MQQMKYCVFVLAVVLLSACKETAEQKKQVTEDVLDAAGTISTPEVDSACYLLTDGGGKDSLVVTIQIKGNGVTGYMIYNYYQKDGRFGKLIGTKKGNEIKADWIYMQEGMTDTVAVAFKLNGQNLEQQKNDFNPQTGEEFLADDAPYDRTYNKVDCSVTERLVSQARRYL
jgi:hypothetical protein